MRQHTIGSLLEELLKLEYNYLCKIQLMIENPTANNPKFGSTVANGILIQVHNLTSEETLNRSANYDMQVSHEAFLEVHKDIKEGTKLILTHRILENGNSQRLTEEVEFQVLGVIEMFGMPEPFNQIQLDLYKIK